MNKHLLFLIAILVLGFNIFVWLPKPLFAADSLPVFTKEELAKYDGKDGHPSYYAFEGKVYDVSSSLLWKLGEHFGHIAGKDLTGKLEGAPHGKDLVTKFPVVGTYISDAVEVSTAPVNEKPVAQVKPVSKPAWYEGRIRLLGISILGWTGIFLGVFFALNFSTCYAMPWHNINLPWKRQGKDWKTGELVIKQAVLGDYHKLFTWGTVLFGLVHGILGFLQLLGVYL